MRKRIITALLAAVAIPLGAQNVSDLIISEVLAVPGETSLVDDYGRRGGWIEIYNTSRGTVKFGGCFLTDDPKELRKSPIPKSDLRTQIGPCQTAVIYASGRGADGTFYAGITLAPGKTVYLVSNDGRTIIDSLTVPSNLPAGKSVSKVPVDAKGFEFEIHSPTEPSPGTPNSLGEEISKSEQMKEKDPYGWILTVVSVTVVFCALAVLWFLFYFLFDRRARRKQKASEPATKKFAAASSRPKGDKVSPDDEVAAAIAMALDLEEGGDIYAAIALALHLHLSETVHDTETFRITIRREGISQWNDKTQTFRRLPR